MFQMEEKTIQLAALLHDVGKFWQGAGEKEKHPELSRKFINLHVPEQWQESAGLVSQHHNRDAYRNPGYKPLKTIVCADWLSSGERRELTKQEEGGERKETPLSSIFSEINIGKGKPALTQYYPIRKLELNREAIFPKQPLRGKVRDSYANLWHEFVEEIERIEGISAFEAYFNTLYHILQKYTWCVPSAVWKTEPDVSLFDHLKTTCAIATCLYKDNVDEEYLDNLISGMEKNWRGEELNDAEKIALDADKFILIGGDISGVQNFIYSITSKGAAKGLRGRSFYLELLSESIAKYILRELNLPITNLLYCGGGHFYILAPSIIEKDLMRIRRVIAKRLLEFHGGDLYLVLDWHPLSANDFQKENFGMAWMDIVEKIAKRKKRRFEEILERYDDIFGPFDEGGSKPFCDVCGAEIKENGVDRCNLCKSLEELAKELSDANILLEIIHDKRGRVKKGTWEDLLSEFGFKYEFHSESELGGVIKRIEAEHVFIYKLNSTEFLKSLDVIDVKSAPFSFGFKFIAKETPIIRKKIEDIEGKIYEGKEIKNFDDLAEDSEGIKRWAVLRADVDNLGKIFSEGLGENGTISRVSNLSSMLSLFFKGWMEEICGRYKNKNRVYAIYSGGDDLFMVGSWDQIPEIAKEIYDDFRAFTCMNPNITISAGITIAPSKKYPLYQAADLAKEALDKSKGMRGKNSITFMDMPMKWDKFSGEVSELKDKLMRLLDKVGVSRGFLQKLYAVYAEYDRQKSRHGEVSAKYDDRYGRWRWLLAYVVARTKVSKENEGLLKETEKLIRKNIEYLPIAVRWVEFLTRRE